MLVIIAEDGPQFLLVGMCFCVSETKVGMNLLNAVRSSVAALTVLSCMLTSGNFQWDRSRRCVPVILMSQVAGAYNLSS